MKGVVLACVALIAVAVVVVLWFTADAAPEPPSFGDAAISEIARRKLGALRAAVVEEPTDASRWLAYGRCLQAHELFEQARTCYAVSAADEKHAFESLYLTAFSLMTTDREAALEAFARAAEVRDDYFPLHVLWGETAEQIERLDDAERHFLRALEIERSNHALLGLGRVAWARDDPEAARRHLEEAARLAPDHGEVFALLATVCRQLGDTKASERYSKRAGIVDSRLRVEDAIALRMYVTGTSVTLYHAVANALLRQSKPEAALRFLDDALATRPERTSRLWFLRSRALFRLDRLPEALASLERCLQENPKDVEALGNAAGILIKLGRPGEAAPLLDRALAVDPEHPNTLHLASYLAAGDRPGDAIEFARRAVDADPGNVTYRLHLASVLSSFGRSAEAESELRRALELAPGDARARAMLADLESRK